MNEQQQQAFWKLIDEAERTILALRDEGSHHPHLERAIEEAKAVYTELVGGDEEG